MSIKIKLNIRKELNLELIEDGIELYIYRLIARVRILDLKKSLVEEVIIDTGSPITIIPHSLWKDENITLLKHKNKYLFGFDKNLLKGNLAKVRLSFIDDINISPTLDIKAYLIYDDSIPLIIGMEDIINKVRIVTDGKKQKYYIEF